jgi:hypothetical protein
MKFKSPEELPQTGNGSKNFLKLKDKESVQGIFRGELHEFYVLWENGKSREVSAGTPEAKFRFRINFVSKDSAGYTAKIFEQGLSVYNQLAELHNEYELDKIVVKITRNGIGTDTTYSILPLLKAPITKDTFKYLEEMPLLPLTSANSGEKSESSDIPF